ncbi:zf-HC2 domain-containing protein [Candidatus Poribacteria bacterium]|nr:zf-HC2 domain-containing protein [Candidatus Poribacteria bacterium]
MLKSDRNECKSIQASLSAYIDKELAYWKKIRIQRHLKHCSGCKSQVKSIEHIDNTLRLIEPIKASENFINVVMSKTNTVNYHHKEKQVSKRIVRITSGIHNWVRSHLSVSNPVFMFSFIFGLFMMIGATLYSPQIEKLNLLSIFNVQSIENSQEKLISFEVITEKEPKRTLRTR